MADNNLYRSLVNLKEVGESHKIIDDYIITDNSEVIRENDGLGNIIIYTNENEGVTYDDFNKTSYTSLYIGDEHIASGFGFKTINEKNQVIDNLNTTISELNTLNSKYIDLRNICEDIINLSDNKLDLTVDKQNNYLYFNNYKYILDTNEHNQLYFRRETDFKINDIKLYYDIFTENDNVLSQNNFISLYNNEEQWILYSNKLKFTKIIITFENAYPVTGWNLTYKFNDKLKEVIDANINENNIVYKLFEYNFNEDIYGEVYNGQYIIDLENCNIDTLKQIVDIDLIISLFDKNNNNSKTYLPTIHFCSPIYYCLSVGYDNYLDTIFNNEYILKNSDDQNIELFFNDITGDSVGLYSIIAIPLHIYNLYDNISFKFKKQFEISMKWQILSPSKQINDITYIIFGSPIRYTGDITWILSLKHFEE